MPGPVFITGKYASISIGGVLMCLDSWDLDESGEPVEVTTWCSPRGLDGGVIRAEYEPGLIEGSFTASGPFRGVAPAIGDVVNIVFGVNSTITAARQCLITGVKISTELKGKASVSISGKVVGLPTTFAAMAGAAYDPKSGWTAPVGTIDPNQLAAGAGGGPLVWGPGAAPGNPNTFGGGTNVVNTNVTTTTGTGTGGGTPVTIPDPNAGNPATFGGDGASPGGASPGGASSGGASSGGASPGGASSGGALPGITP